MIENLTFKFTTCIHTKIFVPLKNNEIKRQDNDLQIERKKTKLNEASILDNINK